MAVSLSIRPSRLLLWLLVPSLALVAQSAGAAEPLEKAFVGVTIGVTTEKELRQNEQWGRPVEQTLQEDGSKLLEFRFGIWKKVVALVESGVVRVIDVTPPDRARAEELSKVLDLGELIPVASRQPLPGGALVGTPVSVEWQPFRSSGAANVLLFAHETSGKWYARLVRFYSLDAPRAPSELAALNYVPASSNVIVGLDARTMARDPRTAALVAPLNQMLPENVPLAVGHEGSPRVLDHCLLVANLDAAHLAESGTAGEVPVTWLLNTQAPFDLDELRKAFGQVFTRMEHRGKSYYLQAGDMPVRWYLPTGQTLIFSTQSNAQFAPLIESSGSQPSLSPRMMAAVSRIPPAGIWLAMPYDLIREQSEAELREDVFRDESLKQWQALMRDVEILTGWGNLRGDQLQVVFSGTCTDESIAERLAANLRVQFDSAKEPGVEYADQFEKEVLETIRINTDGTRVLVSAQVSLVPALAQLEALLEGESPDVEAEP